MKNWLIGEIKNLVWVFIPFLFLIFFVLLFNAECIDYWCVFVIPFLWKCLAISMTTTLITYSILRRFAISPVRSGIATWLIHFKVFLLFVAYSQFYEGDILTGIITIFMFVILCFFTFMLIKFRSFDVS